MIRKQIASTVLGLSLVLSTSITLQAAPPATIEIADAEGSDDVVIPIPQEIFSSLDKLGVQNWKQQAYSEEYKLNPNRSRTALIFGLQISEGFILVQAKDKEGVMEIGREVIKLAGALGVESSVDTHAFAIINEAERENWSVVKREMDKTRQTVIETMRELRDDALADLVSVGGWLGGTRALSAVLKSNYSKEGSDLLNQPLLLEEISKRFDGIPASSKRGNLFDQVSRVLKDLQPLMTADETGLIEEKAVSEINELTHSLSKTIYE